MFWEERTGPDLERFVGVEKGEFERSRLRGLAEGFAEEAGARHFKGTLGIVTSEADSERVRGVRATDGLYADWRREWMEEYRMNFPVARVSVIGGGVRLEWRMADGSMAREVVRGGDPLVVEAGGRRYELFHVLAREMRGRRGEGPVSGYLYQVVLAARDGGRVPLHEAVVRAIARRLRTRRLQVRLQMNTWFRDANLPTVYPFAPPVIPPMTLREASPFESWCELAGDRVECAASP